MKQVGEREKKEKTTIKKAGENIFLNRKKKKKQMVGE